jgi:hypothetical protein
MKRDMDLVRGILLALEARDPEESGAVHVDGYTERAVMYHSRLLMQAGLIEAIDSPVLQDAIRVIPLRLTWSGHEFLDAARSPAMWSAAKKRAGDGFASLPLDVVKALLTKTAKDAFGL